MYNCIVWSEIYSNNKKNNIYNTADIFMNFKFKAKMGIIILNKTKIKLIAQMFFNMRNNIGILTIKNL